MDNMVEAVLLEHLPIESPAVKGIFQPVGHILKIGLWWTHHTICSFDEIRNNMPGRVGTKVFVRRSIIEAMKNKMVPSDRFGDYWGIENLIPFYRVSFPGEVVLA